jgi:hypothetical protein
MITFLEATLDRLSVHKAGNKLLDELYRLSEQPLTITDEMLNKLLMQYFLLPFEKVNEIYRFAHPSDNLSLNEVYHFASAIFDDPNSFHENTQQLTKHLYDVASHPKIKAGELYVAYFSNLQIEGELHDAIGIFKSESKEPFLRISPEQGGYQLGYEQEAINIKKLDKGCLIFHTDRELGYKVAVIDQTNRSTDSVYWMDEFLKLKVRNDNYNQTHTTLSVYKDFITQQLDDDFEISRTDKIELLNRSMKYFKEKDQFDLEEFSNEVIGDPKGIESFKTFKSNYEEEYDTQIADHFAISDAAVKKQSRIYKSVLKLDKNFHIYIHGQADMIEKGYDESRALNYYKVYFKEEN